MSSSPSPRNVTVNDPNISSSKLEMWHNVIALFVLISGFLVILLCGIRQCYFSWKLRSIRTEQGRGNVGDSVDMDRRMETVSRECQDCCQDAFDQHHHHQDCCSDRICGGKRDYSCKVKRMSNIQTKIIKMKSKR